MNFFQRLRASFQRFMIGRYGTDTLNRHLIILWLALSVCNLIFHSFFIYILELVLCSITFFRMLSRNTVKRQRENAEYYRLSQSFAKEVKHLAIRFRDRKTTRFFKCPHCKAPIRMPRKVGKFNIRCQKCGGTFQKEFKN